MFPASKIAWAGIVFILIFLTTNVSGPRTTAIVGLRPTPLASRSGLSNQELAAAHQKGVKQVQQSLLDKGHYRGKVDGVFGLRTRASILAFQKAGNLPVTGQLDTGTADGLGVKAESNWGTVAAAGGEIRQAKPSAGIKWANGRGRASKKPRKEISRATTTEDNRQDGVYKQQAENERHDP